MSITKAELVKQLEELLRTAERRAEEQSLEVEELQELLAKERGARSSQKQLHFELNALNCQLRESRRDLEQTAEGLAAARMRKPNEPDLEAGQYVRESR